MSETVRQLTGQLEPRGYQAWSMDLADCRTAVETVRWVDADALACHIPASTWTDLGLVVTRSALALKTLPPTHNTLLHYSHRHFIVIITSRLYILWCEASSFLKWVFTLFFIALTCFKKVQYWVLALAVASPTAWNSPHDPMLSTDIFRRLFVVFRVLVHTAQ